MRTFPLLIVAVALVAGCSTPPRPPEARWAGIARDRPLTEKEANLATFLLARGFVEVAPLEFSRRYSSLDKVRRDFALSDHAFVVPPNGNPWIPPVYIFFYEDLGFVAEAQDGTWFKPPKTGWIVSVFFDQVSAKDEPPKGVEGLGEKAVEPPR